MSLIFASMQAYDKCIDAIQDDRASPQMSTWDC